MFFYKNTPNFRALPERFRVSSNSSTTRVFTGYALFQANPIISTNSSILRRRFTDIFSLKMSISSKSLDATYFFIWANNGNR